MLKIAFYFLSYLFALMLAAVYVGASKYRVRTQAIWTMAILLCASKFVFFGALGGNTFNPELPAPLIWTLSWAYAGMCLLLALSIPWALVLLVARKAAWRETWRRAGRAALPAVAWLLAARGVWNGIKIPDVVEVEIACASLPATLDGYRILQLSDIHVSSSATAWRTEALTARANAVGADLIVCTGDIVDGMPDRQADNVRPLCGLRARDGVYFCMGNHEYYSDWWAWQRQYGEWNWSFLRNSWVSPREGLVLAGVDDGACCNPDWGVFGPPPSVNQAFAGAPQDAFRVLLQHRPYQDYALYGETPAERFDLQLSGHTHGGIMPVLGEIVRLANNGFVSGLYAREDGSSIYVSPGSGQWSGFPVRYFNDPEITVFTLRRESPRKN